MLKTTIYIFIISIMFNGCVADYFTLGKNKSYCEEHGCDYADAGVCEDPFEIIQNKKKYNKLSYSNVACKQGGK